MPITRPPKLVPGIGRFTDPVASTIAFASIVSPPTLTLPSAVSDPSPSITSIAFFLNRPETPPVSVEMTFRRRSLTAS